LCSRNGLWRVRTRRRAGICQFSSHRLLIVIRSLTRQRAGEVGRTAQQGGQHALSGKRKPEVQAMTYELRKGQEAVLDVVLRHKHGEFSLTSQHYRFKMADGRKWPLEELDTA
jgi:hypothetical protein